jgi:predicted HD phosphohydrolase
MQEMTEAADAWDEIQALYAQSGTRRYGLQSVSQLEHALQSAALAARQGEDDEMVVASLPPNAGSTTATRRSARSASCASSATA